ncbi:MAG: hypothetical protein U9O87_01480 [Verrucomicrobiota bacterium]|nr:hypothetical protein [Verrucomicrobiota bacterium]
MGKYWERYEEKFREIFDSEEAILKEILQIKLKNGKIACRSKKCKKVFSERDNLLSEEASFLGKILVFNCPDCQIENKVRMMQDTIFENTPFKSISKNDTNLTLKDRVFILYAFTYPKNSGTLDSLIPADVKKYLNLNNRNTGAKILDDYRLLMFYFLYENLNEHVLYSEKFEFGELEEKGFSKGGYKGEKGIKFPMSAEKFRKAYIDSSCIVTVMTSDSTFCRIRSNEEKKKKWDDQLSVFVDRLKEWYMVHQHKESLRKDEFYLKVKTFIQHSINEQSYSSTPPPTRDYLDYYLQGLFINDGSENLNQKTKGVSDINLRTVARDFKKWLLATKRTNIKNNLDALMLEFSFRTLLNSMGKERRDKAFYTLFEHAIFFTKVQEEAEEKVNLP